MTPDTAAPGASKRRAYYVVRVINRDLGYADENAYGPFTTRQKAMEWSEKVDKIIARSPDADDLFTSVDYVERPLLRTIRDTYLDAE